LDAGAALLEPLCEGRGARPGSENTAEVRDGSPRNLRDPMSRHARCRTGKPVQENPRPSDGSQSEGARERTRTSERRVGPDRETISGRVQAVGSRSAAIVLRTLGNAADADPVEGRAVPRTKNRRWETRREL